MYYTTPHSTTGKTPTELMFGRTIRSKIPNLASTAICNEYEEVRDQDKQRKLNGKILEDAKRHAKPSNLKEGDEVVLKKYDTRQQIDS